MNQHLEFIDGIGHIRMIEGVMRFDLLSFSVDEEQKRTVTPVGALAMPLSGFVQMHEQMQIAMDAMVEKGIIKKNEPITLKK
jgi:hypothetical protein